jgi:hypothetical protein
MDADEARACLAGIRANIESAAAQIGQARHRVLDLERRQGWKALRYPSLRACLTAELGKSQAHVYRQLAAAHVEETLGLPLGSQPEGRIRNLSTLKGQPELQRFAWRIVELVAEVHNDSEITGALIEDAVELVRDYPELAGGRSTWANEEADELFVEPDDADKTACESQEYVLPDEPAIDLLTDEDVISQVEDLLACETPDVQAAMDLAELAPLAEVRASLKKKIAATVQSLKARARLRAEDSAAMVRIAELLQGIEDLASWPEQRERLVAAHAQIAYARLSEAMAQAQLPRAASAIAAQVGAAGLVNGFQVSYDAATDEWSATDAVCGYQLFDRSPAEIMASVQAAADAIAEGWQVHLVEHEARLARYRLSRPEYGGLSTDEGSSLPSLLKIARGRLAAAQAQEQPRVTDPVRSATADRLNQGAQPEIRSAPELLRQAHLLATLTQGLATRAAAMLEQVYLETPVAPGLALPEFKPDALDTLIDDVLNGTPITDVVQRWLHEEPV